MSDDPLLARLLGEDPATGDDPLLDRVLAPEPRPSLGQRAARLIGNFGAGANESIAGTLGAVPDLYNRLLAAAGIPHVEPGAYRDTILRAINSVVGEPPAPETPAERFAHGAGRGTADAASVLIPAAAVARGAQAGTVLQGAAQALASAPVTQSVAGAIGGGVGEATDSPLLGTAAAIATPVAARGLTRMIAPTAAPNLTPEAQRVLNVARQEGIPTTPGQETGSRLLQRVEAAFADIPATQGREQAMRRQAQEAFNRAVMSRTGTPATNATPETLQAIRQRVGGTIGDIANRNTLHVTPGLEQRLAQVEDSLRFIPAEAAGPVRARIDQLRGMMVRTPPQPPPAPPAPSGSPGTSLQMRPSGNQGLTAPGRTMIDPSTTTPLPQGAGAGGAGAGAGGAGPQVTATVPGASYRMLDSALGRSMRSTTNGDLRAALGDLRTTLREAMDDSISPGDAAAWREARRQYANLMTVAGAMDNPSAITAAGDISPAALGGALRRSLGQGQGFAFGQGDLNDLARLGQLIKPQIQDSGTAGRTALIRALQGQPVAGAGIGAITGTMAAGPAGGVAGAAMGAAGGAALRTGLPKALQSLYYSDAGRAYLGSPGQGRQALLETTPEVSRELVAALLAQRLRSEGTPAVLPGQ